MSRLTAAQAAMLFEQIQDPSSVGNNVVATILIRSSATDDQVRAAWADALAAHPVLTSRVAPTDAGYVIQPTTGRATADVARVARVASPAVRDELERRVLRPFDVFDGPLLHAYARSDGEHVVAVIAAHHLLVDVISAPMALNEFFSRLHAAEFGVPGPLLPPAQGYDDHVVAELTYLGSAAAEADREYWRATLAGFRRDPLTGLPAARPADGSATRARTADRTWLRVEIEPGPAAQIRGYAATHDASPASVLLTAYLRALRTASRDGAVRTDLAVALPVLRRGPEHAETLGSFTQLSVVRAEVGGLFVEDLEAVARSLVGARRHGALPINEIISHADDPAAVVRTTFLYEPSYIGFGTAFVLGDECTLDMSGYEGRPYPLPSQTGQFALRLQAGMVRGRYVCAVHYMPGYEHAADAVAAAFAAELRTLIEGAGTGAGGIVVAPETPGSGWSHPAANAAEPAARDVLDRIGAVVQRNPHAPAVTTAGRSLDYAALWWEAGRIAELVGPGTGDPIGVMMAKGTDAVAAILGILRAGLPFVVIDPGYPRERRAVMLDGLPAVIVDDHAKTLVPKDFRGTTLRFGDRPCGDRPEVPLPAATRADRSAYVVFTSGSTGLPKRVLVGRAALARSTAARDRHYGAGVGAFLHLSSLSFDSAYAGLFWTLATGGELVLADMAASPSTAELAELVKRHEISHLLAIPSVYEALLCDEPALLDSLREVIVAGEECSPRVRAEHARLLPGARLTNEYGPSEATVWSTAGVLTAGDGRVSIGRAVDGITVDVLDDDGSPVPPGTVGELMISGTLADGYLGDPRATAAAFRPDPRSDAGGRAYATGDLAEIGLDGALYFHGRNDQQVKVSGHRVELAEVEAALSNATGLTAVALGVPGAAGRRELAAVIERSGPVDTTELRRTLARSLPGYMVPRFIQTVESLPRNVNGKVDRPRLALDLSARRTAGDQPHGDPAELSNDSPDRGATEGDVVLAAVCRGLGVDASELAPDATFIESGGDSISAMRVIGYLQRRGMRLAPRDLLGEVPVRRLAELVEDAGDTRSASREQIVPTAVRGVPASTGQRAMLLQSFAAPEQGVYVEQLILDLDGADPWRLRDAFRAVFRAFPVLTCAPGEAPHAELVPAGADAVPIDVIDHDLTGRRGAAWRAADRRRGFESGSAALSRVAIAATAAGTRCVWTHHHAVADGWSLPVILSTLAAAYRGEEAPAPQALAAVPDRRTFAASLPTLLERLPEPASPALADAPRSHEVPVPEHLGATAEAWGVTTAALLNTAWALTLGGAFGAAEVGHGIVGSGRRIGVDGADRAVGMFIRIDPIRTAWREDESVRAVARRVGARMADALGAETAPVASPESIVVVENYPLDPACFDFGAGVRVAHVDLEERTEFPLTVQLRTWPALRCELHVDPGRIPAEVARRLADRLSAVLAECVDLGDAVTVGRALDVDTGHARSAVRSAAVAATAAGLVERITAHARRTPGRLAVRTADERIDHAELDRRRCELVDRLRTAGVRAGEVIVVRAPQDSALAPVLLAIRSVGAAWMVVDEDVPAARVAAMIDRSGARWRLDGAVPDRVTPLERALAGRGDGAEPAPSARQIAYLVFTSGTTGEPKCIAVSEAAFTAHLDGIVDRFGYTGSDTVLVFGSLGFDASLEQLFGGLLAGAATVVRPRGALAPADVDRLLRDEAVTVFNPPTGYWKQYLAAGIEVPATVRAVIVGGEALPAHATAAVPVLWNAYGPTEAVVTALSHAVRAGDDGPVPIGAPASGRGVAVVGDTGREVERGIVGEIILTGPLAAGYLGESRATAAAFRPESGRAHAPGARAYRTGDLGAMAEDGTVRYIGRRDRQLKIRGYRLDPNEIEAVAVSLPGVVDARALTVARPGGQPRLDCVVVPAATASLAAAGIRDAMADRLPKALLPARVHVLGELPLTRSGKVDDAHLRRWIAETEDRTATGGPERATMESAGSEPAGTGRVDGAVRAAWRLVLGATDPGTGFLSAGGDSLRALELCALVRGNGVLLDPAVALGDGTVDDLVAAAEADPAVALAGVQPDRSSALPPAVHWFRDRVGQSAPGRWNMAARVTIDALVTGDDLETVGRELLRVHPMLRARLVTDGAGAPEFHLTDAGPVLICFDAQEAEAEYAQRRVFNAVTDRVSITTGTPFALGAVRVVDRARTEIIVVAHHFVMDVVSLQIVAADLRDGLARCGREPGFRLPAEGTSVHEWSTWLASTAREAGAAERVRAAYRGVRAGAPTAPAGLEGEAVTVHRSVPAAIIRRACDGVGAAVDEVLQAAAASAFSRMSGDACAVLEIETHGRALHAAGIDLSRTVGWFTGLSTVPVHDAPVGEQIAEIRARRAYLGRDGQGAAIERYLAGRDPVPGLVPGVGVNYVGRLDGPSGGVEPFGAGRLRSPDVPRPVAVQVDAWLAADDLVVAVEGRSREDAEEFAEAFADTLLRTDHADPVPVHAGFVAQDLGGNELRALTAEFGALDCVAPLTPAQEAMYLRSQSDGAAAAYVEQLALGLPAGYDADRLVRACSAAIVTDPLLRGAIAWEGLSEPVLVTPARPQDDLVRAYRLTPAERDGFAADEVAAIAAGPHLARIAVVDGPEPTLVVTFHHLAADGWSIRGLLARVSAAYAAAAPTPPGTGTDLRAIEYMVVQSCAHRLAAAAATDRTPAVLLPDGVTDAAAEGGNVDLTEFLDPDTARAVRRAAARHGVTSATLAHAAWALELGRTGTAVEPARRVRFGSIAQNRPPGYDDAPGMYVNARAVHADLVAGSDPAAVVAAMHAALQGGRQGLVGASTSEMYETAVIVDDERGTGAAATFLGHPVDVRWSRERTGLALTMSLIDLGAERGMEATLNCDTARLSVDVGRRVLAGFVVALTGLSEDDGTVDGRMQRPPLTEPDRRNA